MTLKRFGALAKIAVSVGLLFFLLSRLNHTELIAQVAHAQPLWLLLALALYWVAILLGVFKWRLLVQVQKLGASYGDLAAYTFAGLFLGNVLPSNIGGDVVRAYALARAGNETEAAVTSVVVDRLMGLVAFFCAALVNMGLLVLLVTGGTQLEAIEIATVVAATIFAIGCALLFSRRVTRRLAFVFAIPLLARFKPRAQRLYHALQTFRSNYMILAANVVVSAGVIVVATFVWYAVALALGLDIPLIYFFLFNPLIAFVLMLPISFNGLGPKEATAVFFFGLVGVPSESAFALSLIFHAIVVLASLPGGVLWWRARARVAPMLPRADEAKIE
ncbi:MAG: flippase-like domain-containing protein [Chloroflexi bacterium]|nr:flippase-like domain-containing protein [Chloroflexota bacterium]